MGLALRDTSERPKRYGSGIATATPSRRDDAATHRRRRRRPLMRPLSASSRTKKRVESCAARRLDAEFGFARAWKNRRARRVAAPVAFEGWCVGLDHGGFLRRGGRRRWVARTDACVVESGGVRREREGWDRVTVVVGFGFDWLAAGEGEMCYVLLCYAMLCLARKGCAWECVEEGEGLGECGRGERRSVFKALRTDDEKDERGVRK